MKKMKTIVALLLAVVMVFGLAACNTKQPTETQPSNPTDSQTNNENPTTTTSPDVDTGIKYPLDTDIQLRIYLQAGFKLPSGYTNWDDVPFLKGLEERWGVDIIWESAPVGSDETAAYNLMLQDEDLPQIIFG